MKLTLTNQELSTVLAALRYYQQEKQADPLYRDDDIHDIATNGGTLTSLDNDGIDALCERINLEPKPGKPRGRPTVHHDKLPDLLDLRTHGATIKEITQRLNISRTTAYRMLEKV